MTFEKTSCRYDSNSARVHLALVIKRICLMIVVFPLSPEPKRRIYRYAIVVSDHIQTDGSEGVERSKETRSLMRVV